MATILTAPAARLALAASLSALLGACSFGKGQVIQVLSEPDPIRVQQRFIDSEDEYSYSAVVPRAYVEEENLNESAPDAYTVVRGDTLWDISARFLKHPWLWPTVWDYNPQIANPHLIFPGDEIALEYINGEPTLVVARNGVRLQTGSATGNTETTGNTSGGRAATGTSLQSVRLSPRIRSESLNDAIPLIPADSIRQFLVHPRVVSAAELRRAPYVVGNNDKRLISAIGHKVYARGKLNKEQPKYGIFRRSNELRDPLTKQLLGYEVTHVADAKLLSIGDPSILGITSNNMETIAGDVLLATNEDAVVHAYTPRLPEIRGEGRIISLVNAISQTGRDQVVVLNLGERSGIKIGDVLAIESRGGSIIDNRGKHGYERVDMPHSRTGVLMVFKTFDKVSYALIMESNRPILLNDVITGI